QIVVIRIGIERRHPLPVFLDVDFLATSSSRNDRRFLRCRHWLSPQKGIVSLPSKSSTGCFAWIVGAGAGKAARSSVVIGGGRIRRTAVGRSIQSTISKSGM